MKQKNRQLARLNSKVRVLGCTLTMSCRRSHPNAPEGASGASFKCWWHAVESRAGSRIEMDSELMGNGYGYWWYSCPSILCHKDSATGAKSHTSEASYKHIMDDLDSCDLQKYHMTSQDIAASSSCRWKYLAHDFIKKLCGENHLKIQRELPSIQNARGWWMESQPRLREITTIAIPIGRMTTLDQLVLHRLKFCVFFGWSCMLVNKSKRNKVIENLLWDQERENFETFWLRLRFLAFSLLSFSRFSPYPRSG